VTLLRHVLRAGLLCVPVIGCAATQDRTLVETLDTAELGGTPAQGLEGAAAPQAAAPGPSGLINPDERAVILHKLKMLSAERSASVPARQSGASAESLTRLRDTHGQNALSEIGAGNTAASAADQ